MNNFTPRAQQS